MEQKSIIKLVTIGIFILITPVGNAMENESQAAGVQGGAHCIHLANCAGAVAASFTACADGNVIASFMFDVCVRVAGGAAASLLVGAGGPLPYTSVAKFEFASAWAVTDDESESKSRAQCIKISLKACHVAAFGANPTARAESCHAQVFAIGPVTCAQEYASVSSSRNPSSEARGNSSCVELEQGTLTNSQISELQDIFSPKIDEFVSNIEVEGLLDTTPEFQNDWALLMDSFSSGLANNLSVYQC
jgi:hypothetical protein